MIAAPASLRRGRGVPDVRPPMCGSRLWSLAAGLAVVLAAMPQTRAEGSVPPCGSAVAVTILAGEPRPPASARARQEKEGVAAHWVSTQRVVLLPAEPGLRINGAAGLELSAPQPCAVDLAAGYHQGLDITTRRPLTAVSVAVCGLGEDDPCLWVDVLRPF